MTKRLHDLVLRLLRLRWLLGLRWNALRKKKTTVEMAQFVEFYEQLWKDAAERLSARLTEVGKGLWRIERGSRSTLIQNYIVQIDDPVILSIAGDKPLCHRLLMAEGLPVPAHEVFTLASFERAERFMTQFGGESFVVKPATGTSGARGVTTHVLTVPECRSAAVLASLYSARILIERWIAGESYRLLFLDGAMIHASRRRGWRVVGDGRSTLHDLMTRHDQSGSDRRAAIGRDMTATLKAQGLRLDSIPEPGRSVLIQSVAWRRGTTEVRTVFDEDATAAMGAALRDQAGRAVRTIGSNFAGVDIITLDPARSLEEVGGVVNEINTTPGLHHHYGLAGAYPPAEPALRVLERLLGR